MKKITIFVDREIRENLVDNVRKILSHYLPKNPDLNVYEIEFRFKSSPGGDLLVINEINKIINQYKKDDHFIRVKTLAMPNARLSSAAFVAFVWMADKGLAWSYNTAVFKPHRVSTTIKVFGGNKKEEAVKASEDEYDRVKKWESRILKICLKKGGFSRNQVGEILRKGEVSAKEMVDLGLVNKLIHDPIGTQTKIEFNAEMSK